MVRTHLSIVVLRHFFFFIWHQLLAQLDVPFPIFYCFFFFHMNIILWQNRSLGALRWTFSVFVVVVVVRHCFTIFSLASFRFVQKYVRFCKCKPKLKKSQFLTQDMRIKQTCFPFEMRAFCWCVIVCLKAKAESVQQRLLFLCLELVFGSYFFFRNG